MNPVEFRVFGYPQSQGSLTRNRYGKTYQKASLIGWRNTVLAAGLQACREAGWELPFDGPLKVEVEFFLEAPKRPRWPVPATSLDLDKLQRAVGDALSPKSGFKVLTNDSRIVRWNAGKSYATEAEMPGVWVRLIPVI